MAESLGKASLELTADLGPLERELKIADTRLDKSKEKLEKLERQAKAAERALKNIKMLASQGVETDTAVSTMEKAVDELKDKAARARLELKDVKITEAQAVESEVAGHRIESTLDKISRKAGEARRALLGARLAGAGAGGGGAGNGPLSVVGPGFGRGVGPFGSGYGRLGLVGTSILGGALLGPAAGPGALGLLAAIPVLATAGAGSLGTLALAFAGVGKAIGGDKKAFDALQPSQQAFVLRVRSMKGWIDSLRETAGKATFPGLTKGIESALSPGTMSAVTTAVNQFGNAIGTAGEKVGRYLGSPQFQNIFGPLMEEGAHEVGTLTDAVLSLFDAVGVLGRSGIPLTRWITDAAARGARLVDTFVRAREASGGLADGMDEAQDSLRLVAALGVALIHVAGALGEALYPVSKVAVADLTGGLESLAGMIQRNQDKIRELVGGALTALQTTIQAAVPIVGTLATGLDAVAQAIGGWDKAFEIIIGGYLVLKLLAVADAITKVGVASGEAGAAGQVGLLGSRLALLTRLGPYAIILTVAIQNKDAIDAWFASHHMGFMNKNVFEIPGDIGRALGVSGGGQKQLTRQEIGNLFADITYDRLGVSGLADYKGRMSQADYDALMHHALSKKGDSRYAITPMRAAGGDDKGPNIPSVIEGTYTDPNPTDPFGANPPFTKNLGPKGPKPSALDIVFPPRFQAALLNAKANAAGGSMASLRNLLAVAKKSLDYLDAEHRTGKKLVALQRERASIATLIETTEGKIAKLEEKRELHLVDIPQRMQNALAAAKAALGLTGSSPDSAAGLTARAKALALIVNVEGQILARLTAQHVTGKALIKQQKELGQHTVARDKALGALGPVAEHAGIASMAERILGIGSGPTMSSQVAGLRQRERGLLEKVIRKKTGTPEEKLAGLSIDALLGKASPFLTKGTKRSLNAIGSVWELYLKKGFLPDSAIANVKTRLQQFNDTITASFDRLSLSAAQVARKQERAFLETFQAIVSNYAPNATPQGGAVATHLYDIKHETREQTKAMKKVASRVAGSASDYAHGLGMFG